MSTEPQPDASRARFAEQVSVACHDLRTPLATVYGFARTIERLGHLDDRQQRYLGMVIDGAQELTRLIDDLATLTRLERGVQPVERASVELAAMVDEVAVEAAERHAPARAIYARADGAGLVQTDRRLAASALSGLVDGALRLDPQADRLELGVDETSVTVGPLSEQALKLYDQADKDLRLAAARAVFDALHTAITVEESRLRVRFPVT